MKTTIPLKHKLLLVTSKSNFVRNRNEVVQDLLLFENIVMLHPWGREAGKVSLLEHV